MRLLIDCFLFSFDFVVEVSNTSFGSNPDALGFDESEKGIFDSLKNIAQLSPSPLRGDDQLGDSAAGAVGSPVAEETFKEPPATGIGESLDVVDSFFRRAFAGCLCIFQISRLRTSRRVLLLPPTLIWFRWIRRSGRRRNRTKSRLLSPRGS